MPSYLAAHSFRSGVILVLATPATLRQSKFQLLSEKYGEHAVVRPCAGLMDLVEQGELEGPRLDAYLNGLLDEYRGVQLDAARALCLRPLTFFRRVIVPQAAAYLAKPFREEIIRLVELTTVVGYISVWDLTKVVDWIRARTYESFFPIAFATLLYFLLSLSLIAVISLIGKKVGAYANKHTATEVDADPLK